MVRGVHSTIFRKVLAVNDNPFQAPLLLVSIQEMPAAQTISKVNTDNVVMIFLLMISKYADDRWW